MSIRFENRNDGNLRLEKRGNGSFLATTTQIPPVIIENLLLWLDVNNTNSYPGTGTSWFDLTTPQYNGTLTGGSITYDSNNGGSLVFPSSNTTNYITFGRITALQPTSQITLEQWINPDNWTPATSMQTISCTQGGGYAISLRNNGIDCIIYAGGAYRTSQISTIGFSGWKHITTTFDGRYSKMYVNGVLVNTQDAGATYSMTYNPTNGLFIGAEAGSSATIPDAGQKYEGKIGTTLIYNTVLTDSEVLQNFNATKNRFGL